MQDGPLGRSDTRFLRQFALQRQFRRFPHLDPAAGKVPAGHIGMANQEDLAAIVQHDGAHAEGHAPREAEIEVQQTRQRALRQ